MFSTKLTGRITIGKRSDFTKRPKDKYYTPVEGVTPLIPFLSGVQTFVEPCAGDGRLVRHLERHGLRCVRYSDLEPGSIFVRKDDALTAQFPDADAIITNPPWSRDILHALIKRFLDLGKPFWFLFDADWPYTVQKGEVRELLKHCSHIVAVGRLKWIEDSNMSGKDNSAWFRFYANHTEGPRFYPR